jgi:hypothetical protein
MSNLPKLDLKLHAKQTIAYLSKATEILYGGAAGGGKSHLMRVALIIWCSLIPGLQCYLFRRLSEDLIKNHMEGPKGFQKLLAPWIKHGFVLIVKNEIRFWNDSKIFLNHCQYEKDKYKYDGAEIHVLVIDELTHFTETIYRFLRGRVRMVGVDLPEQFKGCFPRVLNGTNPGNIGHAWVKKSFIDNRLPLEIEEMVPKEGGMLRQFIPALLEDNPSMTEDDPTYENKLEGLGSEALVKAKRYGIWDIIEGAYFDNWDKDKHVLEPFKIPEDWLKFRSFDWGSAKPFSVGWYAISPGYVTKEGLYIPKGSMVKYREWYGCKEDKEDVGLKMTVEQVADGIIERDGEDAITYSIADPSIFSLDGGPTKAERYAIKGVYFNRAGNKRTATEKKLGGWDLMRHRLNGIDDRPMLFFFKTCFASIRTIPTLLHDVNKPEDLNTKMEDHAADECRYACMSNPWTPPEKIVEHDKPDDRYDDTYGDEEDGWR